MNANKMLSVFSFFLLATVLPTMCDKTCTSSSECTSGGWANCCSGTCTLYYEKPCGPGACAKGEIWFPNRSDRYCLNASNPCAGSAQKYDPCGNAGTCAPGKNGNYSCINCPPGLSGQYCDICSTSNACTVGTLANCCGSKCETEWSGVCEKTGCAKGEILLPNRSWRFCLNATDPCSGSAQKYDPCGDAGTCAPAKNGTYSCINCPPGLSGQYCDICSTSSVCNSGSAADCCGAKCVENRQCQANGCAKGEVWMPNRSQRYCLNATNPCSKNYDPCGRVGTCAPAKDGTYSCLNCPPGLSGQYCDICSTSSACNIGSFANCCGSKCVETGSGVCEKTGCAKGEVWIPNRSDRHCMNATNPCNVTAPDYNPCGAGTCTPISTKNEMNGSFWCANCPPGLGGQYCELCSTSDACANRGTYANCCNSQCIYFWSGVCEKYGCAKGEVWTPNGGDLRYCLKKNSTLH